IKKQPAKLVQRLLYEQQVQRFTGVALTLPQRTRALHWRHEVSAARMVRPETACRCVGVTPGDHGLHGARSFRHAPWKAPTGRLESRPVNMEQTEPRSGFVLIRPLVVVHDRPV